MSEKKQIYQQALDALKRREGLFRVLIFSFITVLIWIGFSVFRANTRTKVSIDTQKHTKPLNPNINQEVFADLASRKIYTEQELESFTIYERIIDERGNVRLIIAGSEEDVVQSSEPSNQVFDEAADNGSVATGSAEATEGFSVQGASPSAEPSESDTLTATDSATQ